MNINGDKYPNILKSNINFFLMTSLKDIAIDFLNNNNNN